MSTTSRQPYKAQELLALRDSVSETAVAVEKFGDDDAIKGKFIFVHLKVRHHKVASTSPNHGPATTQSRRSVAGFLNSFVAFEDVCHEP